MRLNNILTSFLLLGSICILLIGCVPGKTDYVFNADWVYVNNSSHDIVIDGIRQFSFSENIDITIPVNDSFKIKFRELGGKEGVNSDGYPLPAFQSECKIITNDTDYQLEDGRSIRSRENYVIEKLSFNHYQFTYVFTDENIAKLTQ